jgi:8-oxo-dGTP pyrophosphatase MutT (NUDIX family)
MAERLLRVPEDVRKEALHLAGTSTGVDGQRYADIGSGMMIGRSTMLALIAASDGPKLRAWASRQYQAVYDLDQEQDLRALTAAAVDEDDEAVYYGILDPAAEEATVAHVVRASTAGLERWTREGWVHVPEDLWPTYLPFRELPPDVLADALTACIQHSGLVLRAETPRAFLPVKMPFTIVASVAEPGVYAAVDETDTTAVINLCRYDGAQTFTREPGSWVPDDITLPWLVASGVPLALIPDTELRGLLRSYDDHLAVFPLIAAATSDPSVAGLGVRALDTGRVLMLQRALAPNGDDPAAGTWEMPGGHLDPGEDPLSGAIREWQEETGCQLPDGSLWGVWHSPDGVYQGHIYNVNSEADVPIHDGRDQVINPDDPDGDLTEALAWWDPRDLSNPLVRPELANQTNAVHTALGAGTAQPEVAAVVADAVAHTRTPRQLEDYWVRGEGAAKIRWGAARDWYRCVEQLAKYVHNPYVVKGQCNSLHKIATGLWPATHDKILHGGKGK